MGRRALLIGVLLLLGLATFVAWLVLSGDSSTTARSAAPESGAAAVGDAQGDPRRARVERPADPAVPAGEPPAEIGPAEVEVTPWPANGIEVDVLVSEGRTPVPNAIVFARVRSREEWAAVRRPDAYLRDGADDHAVLRRTGLPYRADETGRVRLPAPPADGHLWVGCEHGDLVGQLGVSGGDGAAPQQLLLVPRVRLRVRVIDEDGRPLFRFPVHLVQENPWDATTTALAETGADGIAVFHDLGELREWGEEDDSRVFVRAAIPMADPPRALVDVRDPPRQEPLELVIPPTGSVRVIVEEPEGAPQMQRAYVSLVVDENRPRWYDRARVLVADLTFGVATFPRVGTGVRLVARVVDEDERLASLESRFPGPARAGERIVHQLRLHGERLVVLGRVVDEHAAPIPALYVSAGAKAMGDDAWMHALGNTDAAGRFRMVLDHSRRDTLGRRLEVYATQRIGPGSQNRQILDEPLPPTLTDGPLDVGDLLLAPESAIVAGRLVDAGGNPVPGVGIGLQYHDGWRWVVARIRGESDADGYFVLRGELDVDATRLRLIPQDDVHVHRTALEVDPGTADVVVELIRAGSLAGSLLLPVGTKGEDIDVVVSGSAIDRHSWRDGPPGRPSRAGIHDDGRFEASGLVDGTADVEVRFDGHAEPLVVVRGVRVVAGQVNRDPRLDAIDLTKKMTQRGFRVVDTAGAPVPQALVHFRMSGADGDWHDARADGAGQVVVSAPPGPVDVLAMAPGHASRAAVGVGESTTLRLARAAPVQVEVVLAPESAVPADPRKVVVTLAWLAPLGPEAPDVASDDLDWSDPRSTGMPELPLLPGGAATFTAREPGWYAVQVMIEQDELMHYSQWVIPADAGGEPFEIAPGAGSRRITVRLTEANLTAND